GGGRAPQKESVRSEASVVPQGVAWIKDSAEHIDPEEKVVTTATGARIAYDHLVVCTGNQLNWDAVPGLDWAIETPAVSSNYAFDLAPRTWERIRSLRSGTAVIAMPSGPSRRGGAPQRFAAVAAARWRQPGVLEDIRVVLVRPTPAMSGVPEFSAALERVAARYGIEVHSSSAATEIDGAGSR